ncbi:alpha/beta hydrolase-fold protein [Streptomyces sp. NBC_00335]|uniref:alpha/beta hydrolase n=1 Tax=unclassified Streptomyces TaxID=2593676 RepID=UPI00225ACC58|nr:MULTISPECIES: alpha/beta hydrolase-fold protein [unclassified Streptomyces]MCX5403817.1 alpha/beta hydrolase-fold protein [Streptomyces sp. NBC_00086]
MEWDIGGTPALLLAALVAAAVFGAAVWLWPRLAGSGVRPLLGRAGLQLAITLTAGSALLLAVNSSYGFYGSWRDLLSLRREDPAPAGARAPGREALLVRGTRSWRHAGSDDPAVIGRIEAVTVLGTRSGLSGQGYVYLPPQYVHASAGRRAEFPVVLALSGFPSTPGVLIDRLRYPQLALDAVRAGRMRPAVLVLMTPTVAPPRDTQCVDVPGGPRAETFFARDLRAAVSSYYGLTRDARGWGVMGNSVGGYCALKLALRTPDAYRAAAALSAPYAAARDADTGDLFGGDADRRRENDLLWRLRSLPQPPVSLLVTSSRKGEHQYPQTLEFIDAVRAPARVSSILLASGGHNYETWAREAPSALEWLVGRLSPP